MHEVFVKVSSMHLIGLGRSVQSLPVWGGVNVANCYTGAHATKSQLHKYINVCFFFFALNPDSHSNPVTEQLLTTRGLIQQSTSQTSGKSFLLPIQRFPAHNGRSQSTQPADGCSQPESRKAPAHQQPFLSSDLQGAAVDPHIAQ